MSKFVLGGIAILLIGYVFMRQPKLKHFSPREFGVWYPLMSADLLKKLDAFRERWGYPVEVSSAQGAIGREDDSQSQHNVSKWGEVRAIDVFPRVAGGGYMLTASERQRAFTIAKEVGFTGIGLYTDTQPGNLLHLDVRVDKQEGSPAKWSRVNGHFGSVSAVLV